MRILEAGTASSDAACLRQQHLSIVRNRLRDGSHLYVNENAFAKLSAWLGIPVEDIAPTVDRLVRDGTLKFIGESKTGSRKYRVSHRKPLRWPPIQFINLGRLCRCDWPDGEHWHGCDGYGPHEPANPHGPVVDRFTSLSPITDEPQF